MHLCAQVGDSGRRGPPVAHVGLRAHREVRPDMRRAVILARYTGQRQADVLRMGPEQIEDGGINVVQQKTGKKLWVPLHAALRSALEGWTCSPFVQTTKGESYSPDRAAWTRLMNDTPAGRIRREVTVLGRRAWRSSARQVARTHIEAVAGMSPAMITRYSRFADQKRLARAAMGRLEGRTLKEPSSERAGNRTVKSVPAL